MSEQRTETPDVETAPEPKVLFDGPKKSANVRPKQREKQTKEATLKPRHLASKRQIENYNFEPPKSRERDTARRSTSPVIEKYVPDSELSEDGFKKPTRLPRKRRKSERNLSAANSAIQNILEETCSEIKECSRQMTLEALVLEQISDEAIDKEIAELK